MISGDPNLSTLVATIITTLSATLMSSRIQERLAAGVIQGSIQGRLARMDIPEIHRQQRLEAAERIQAGFTQYEAKTEVLAKYDDAAQTLQAGLRGMEARGTVNGEIQSVTTIQAGIHGMQARNNIPGAIDAYHHESAATLQANVWGGVSTRAVSQITSIT